jgi:hypothetical protein
MLMQFPTLEKEKRDLFALTEDLEELYRALNDAHAMITELELQCAELEATYENKLDKYIRKVGLENVAIGLLNYSTNMENWIYEQKDP